jgi:hypothetical protein
MAYTYSLLAETTVGAGGTSAITFNNIPQNYTDLVIKISARMVATSDFPSLALQFNGSAVANYSHRYLLGSGSAASAGSGSSVTTARLGNADGSAQTVNTFSSFEIYIPNYTSSNNKSLSVDSVAENNATAAYANLVAGLWSNVTAISSIKLFETTPVNLAQYSTATLYGIRVEI